MWTKYLNTSLTPWVNLSRYVHGYELRGVNGGKCYQLHLERVAIHGTQTYTTLGFLNRVLYQAAQHAGLKTAIYAIYVYGIKMFCSTTPGHIKGATRALNSILQRTVPHFPAL